MKDDFSKHIIVNSEKLNKLIETKRKIKSIELDDDLFLISYHDINEDTDFIKIKGYKNSISFDELKSLLEENKSLKLNQNKWFRFIDKGSISIKKQIYTLVPTANKRKLVYKDNKLIGTPYLGIL